jgi:hypothetical protein
MIEKGLLELMPATVIINPFLRTSTDGYGQPVYTSPPSSYRARVGFAKRLIPAPEGQGVTPVHVAWVATTAAIDPRSRFRYLGTTYRMISVGTVSDEIGVHHTKIELLGG